MVQVGRRQALPRSIGIRRSQYPSCTNEAKQRIGTKSQCLATIPFSLPPSTAGPVKAILPRYLDSNSFVLEIEAKYHSKKLPAFLFVAGGFFPLPCKSCIRSQGSPPSIREHNRRTSAGRNRRTTNQSPCNPLRSKLVGRGSPGRVSMEKSYPASTSFLRVGLHRLPQPLH